MPRGRPKKKESEVLKTLSDAVGPALEEAVAATQKKEKEKEAKKPVKYCKIYFRNIEDPGSNLAFTYMGKRFNMVEGKEMDVRKEVVDWVNKLTIPKSKIIRDPGDDFGHVKHFPRPRFMCEILEEYEKVE